MYRRESGIFIAFEGGEGSGKSTLSARIFEQIQKHFGPKVHLYREPGSTHLGEDVREVLLKERETSVDPLAELFLFLSARAQSFQEKVSPALEAGDIVLVDRFHASTIAYQSGGRGLDRSMCEQFCDKSSHGKWPDLTIFLDIDPRAGLERSRSCSAADRMENEQIEFHQKIYETYQDLLFDHPNQYARIAADQKIENVFSQGWDLIKALIMQHPRYGGALATERKRTKKTPDYS